MVSIFDIPADAHNSAPLVPDYPAVQSQPLLSADQVQAYINESALEFFEENQLHAILGISEDTLSLLRADPDVAKRIRTLSLQLRDSGEGFKKAAARFAEHLLPDVAALMGDPEAKPMEKLRAAELIANWAGYAPKNTQAVNVEINLASIMQEAETRKRAVVSIDRSYLTEDI